MRKITALVAGSIGYVLGARAGRQRYEQIKSTAMRVKSNPRVQQTAQQVAEAAKEAAPVVKEKVTGGSSGGSGGTSESGSSGTTSTSSVGVTMETSAYPIDDADAKNP
jgi:hypothetical protein